MSLRVLYGVEWQDIYRQWAGTEVVEVKFPAISLEELNNFSPFFKLEDLRDGIRT
jgi:hypothetical protein